MSQIAVLTYNCYGIWFRKEEIHKHDTILSV